MERTTDAIMTHNLVTIGLTDSVSIAYQLMKEKKIRHLPVLDDQQKLTGILTDRDVKRAMPLDAEYVVKDFMSSPVKSVYSYEGVRDAAELMLREKISAVMIVDEAQNPRGIVTTDDMLKLLVHILDKESKDLKDTIETVMRDYFFNPRT